MITATWIKDLVMHESPSPTIMWILGRGLESVSLISPQFLSKSSTVPPKRLVKSVVMAMTPAPMKVRYPTVLTPGVAGKVAVSLSKLLDMAIPKKANHRTGWISEANRRGRDRKNFNISRQYIVRYPVCISYSFCPQVSPCGKLNLQ